MLQALAKRNDQWSMGRLSDIDQIGEEFHSPMKIIDDLRLMV
jgi:hypothetical protein